LHSFAGYPTDGASPYNAGVVLDKKGNLYGTTVGGGKLRYNFGTAFKIVP